jgi:hypothetical protein
MIIRICNTIIMTIIFFIFLHHNVLLFFHLCKNKNPCRKSLILAAKFRFLPQPCRKFFSKKKQYIQYI